MVSCLQCLLTCHKHVAFHCSLVQVSSSALLVEGPCHNLEEVSSSDVTGTHLILFLWKLNYELEVRVYSQLPIICR